MDQQHVDIGLRRVPRLRIADIADMAAADPFLEDERPRADGRLVGPVQQRIAFTFVKMPRIDWGFAAGPMRRANTVPAGSG
jgi:hypothetical protein